MNNMIGDDIERAFNLLDAEISLHLSGHDKAAYEEAKEKALDLIKNESNPSLYLSFNKNDVRKAATQLAKYWYWRKEIFKERAYLPLNQTGKGALSEEDLEVWKVGALSLLPNGAIYVDRWRWSDEMYKNRAGRIRCFFYILSLAAFKKGSKVAEKNSRRPENNDTSDNDVDTPCNPTSFVSFLVRLNDSTNRGAPSHFDQFYVARVLMEVATTAFPFSVSGVHLVAVPHENPAADSLATSIFESVADKAAKLLLPMINKFFGQVTTYHKFSTKKEIVKGLKQYGFSKRSLPVCMGGSWKEENLKHFLRHQLHKEVDMFLTEEDKSERKREAHRIYSRQKRVRRRIEWEVMNEQHADLSTQNKKLKAEELQLKALLKKAQEEVRLYEAGLRSGPSMLSSMQTFSAPLATGCDVSNELSMLQQQQQFLDYQHQLDSQRFHGFFNYPGTGNWLSSLQCHPEIASTSDQRLWSNALASVSAAAAKASGQLPSIENFVVENSLRQQQPPGMASFPGSATNSHMQEALGVLNLADSFSQADHANVSMASMRSAAETSFLSQPNSIPMSRPATNAELLRLQLQLHNPPSDDRLLSILLAQQEKQDRMTAQQVRSNHDNER
jgi:hypothetical protein